MEPLLKGKAFAFRLTRDPPHDREIRKIRLPEYKAFPAS